MLKDFNTKRPVWYGETVIGYLEGTIFTKPVLGSKHRLNTPRAWAIDAEVFDEEVMPNATHFVVLERETGRRYQCKVAEFDRLKGVMDRGYGRQYYLTMNHWRVDGTKPEQHDRQLTLFS